MKREEFRLESSLFSFFKAHHCLTAIVSLLCILSHCNILECKILEWCILIQFVPHFDSCNLQFGFKKDMSASLCTGVLNHVIAKYIQGSVASLCCLQWCPSRCFSVCCPYLDDLLLQLRSSGVGCYWGHHFAGALAHADDDGTMPASYVPVSHSPPM